MERSEVDNVLCIVGLFYGSSMILRSADVFIHSNDTTQRLAGFLIGSGSLVVTGMLIHLLSR